MRDHKFHKDIHNSEIWTDQTNKPTGSCFPPHVASAVSALAYNNPTGVTAPNKPLSLYVYSEQYSAEMLSNGQPTGWTHHFLIAKASGQQYPEIMGIDTNYMTSAFGGVPGSSSVE